MTLSWVCPDCGKPCTNSIDFAYHTKYGHPWWLVEAWGYGFNR